jgi:hypothetical protein
MVEQFPGLPDNPFGFTARGTVTASHYESIVIPAVEALFSRHCKGRFLYRLGEGFSGFEATALRVDTKGDPGISPAGREWPWYRM